VVASECRAVGNPGTLGMTKGRVAFGSGLSAENCIDLIAFARLIAYISSHYEDKQFWVTARIYQANGFCGGIA
jgi:hypothetical protein